VCQVQIDSIKGEINEIKAEQKNQREKYGESIIVMKENLIRLTTLMEKQDEHLEKQDERLEKQDVALSRIGNELVSLRSTVESKLSINNERDSTKWYRKMLESNWKFVTYIILIILSVLLGSKMDSIIDFIK
jgi:hypothetical protein